MSEPVRITLLWHRERAEGKDLAATVFRWFRGDPDDPGEVGRGLPVHYRCLPLEPATATDGSVSRGSSDPTPPGFHIAVPLVDEHLVVDPACRAYLTDLANGINRVGGLLVPVALAASAYQLPFAVSRLNYLRLDRTLDPDHWGWEQRSRVRRERLISLLTQVVARELSALSEPGALPKNHNQEPALPPPIKVFISHAKADGVREAEALRSAILNRGQLQAFYDESDLPIGYAFEHLLNQAAVEGHGAETQAMVVVFSDTYPSRPWCQREIRLARQPRQLGTGGAGARCWRVKPLVIVATLAGSETRMLSEAGQVPLIAWDPDRVGRIIDFLLREILLLRYNELRGLALLQTEDANPDLGRHAINCLPDVYSAIEIAKSVAATGSALTELLIPPPGISHDDRERIGRLISTGADPVRITTFDEAELQIP
ncbi:toll/interleukin-1 receptor domain-containing protein [Candidatus Thiosymbion oneisti]|uniref:toll/interleukin-1 receptor domain-containing protein n=1 Tax=Candidatus Thiosymbion oneisti TaxID=589554 RepID=UPI0013FD72F3|nr:toll/interleukin-1 receptor domain-containing protein [Candidatus Thiosymbion oneisti]